ncbi:uncharacterized protein A1O5_10349 [Cladophialophora psammophila CBS 110553]|uniref:VOC domain-containing protein n=1 Tax=Cladophialophora psammophila CBS 110553 TaxID=1182543 RepID=W9WFG0_9EURO|nr:uncharacterized protein A1O5_10349 [Cladophialophora psammophila CBS 110553]EXJ66678.1 hypothetical protein A1O5_10349 [Cladophialophora psammophila CBS 110553]
MPIPVGDPRMRLLKTAFVIYYHADLAKARQFLLDFGLSIVEESHGEIFFTGYGSEPYVYIARQAKSDSEFGGAAYEVESHEELERATKSANATPIFELDGPGGGEAVTLTDPAGHKVHLVYGQTPKQPDNPNLEKLTLNYEDEKPRTGRFQRFAHGPAPVYRWGHYGVTYPEGKFQEIGLEFTDHHAFFFKRTKPGQKPSVAHAAFEVHDFDIQQLGHQHLTAKGYRPCWGVGRHVLGSQVFDYWFDTSQFVLEHYADGDLVNSETEVAHVPAGPEALYVWGPPIPETFS